MVRHTMGEACGTRIRPLAAGADERWGGNHAGGASPLGGGLMGVAAKDGWASASRPAGEVCLLRLVTDIFHKFFNSRQSHQRIALKCCVSSYHPNALLRAVAVAVSDVSRRS